MIFLASWDASISTQRINKGVTLCLALAKISLNLKEVDLLELSA